MKCQTAAAFDEKLELFLRPGASAAKVTETPQALAGLLERVTAALADTKDRHEAREVFEERRRQLVPACEFSCATP